jgi:hypothetical protein
MAWRPGDRVKVAGEPCCVDGRPTIAADDEKFIECVKRISESFSRRSTLSGGRR